MAIEVVVPGQQRTCKIVGLLDCPADAGGDANCDGDRTRDFHYFIEKYRKKLYMKIFTGSNPWAKRTSSEISYRSNLPSNI